MSFNKVPLCCYCECLATGRCTFMGRDSEVIDNPFCKHHETIVYNQTVHSLQLLHQKGLERELVAVQKWEIWLHAPALPVNKAEFVKLATQQLQA
jgi:hypothetical protein